MTKAAREAKRARLAAVRKRHQEAVLPWIARGETLADYCRQPDTPTRKAFADWVQADEEFAARYREARLLGAEAIAEQCLEIADEASRDTITTEDGREVANTEWIQRSKLRIETRLKLLAKWFPQRYGDSLAVTGAGGEPLLPARPPTAIEAAAAIAGILASVSARELPPPADDATPLLPG